MMLSCLVWERKGKEIVEEKKGSFTITGHLGDDVFNASPMGRASYTS